MIRPAVAFQVTRVGAPLLQTAMTPQLPSQVLLPWLCFIAKMVLSKLMFMLAGAVIQQQLCPPDKRSKGEEKRSNLELNLKGSTNVSSWDWAHGTFL